MKLSALSGVSVTSSRYYRMIRNFYKKLYLYTLLVLMASTILTTIVVNTISRLNFENNFRRIPFMENLVIVKAFVAEARKKNPAEIARQIDWLTEKTHWNISYWDGNKCIYRCHPEHLQATTSSEFARLQAERKEQKLDRKNNGPILMGYLSPSLQENNFVLLSLNNFPPPKALHRDLTLSGFFILLFLGLFLVPYTRFVLKPFEELMKSVTYISEGNFNRLIKISDQSEFREIAETINKMTVKIKEMINQKERMIADVSHELRTPLAKIRLAQELLLKEGKGNQKYINRSIEESENLDKLINDLLDASELELNPDKFQLSKVDFKDVVNENIDKNQLLFQENNLKVNRYFPEKPIPVKVEKSLIERVFNNIFSNITKYAPPNTEVDLTLKEVKGKVIFTVRDYGPGVSPEHREKIFEPFYRTDESRTRETGGTGLGLAIVKKIVEVHGWTIRASAPTDGKSGLVLTIEASAV